MKLRSVKWSNSFCVTAWKLLINITAKQQKKTKRWIRCCSAPPLKLGQSLSHSERREGKKCPSCSQFSFFIHPEFSRYTTYNRQQSLSNQTGVVLIFKRDSWTHLSLWYYCEFLPEVCFSVSTCGCVRKKLICPVYATLLLLLKNMLLFFALTF